MRAYSFLLHIECLKCLKRYRRAGVQYHDIEFLELEYSLVVHINLLKSTKTNGFVLTIIKVYWDNTKTSFLS